MMQQRTGDVRFFSPPPSPHKNGAGAQETFRKVPFIIGVTGGTASGKTTVCQGIISQLGQTKLDSHQKQVVMISQDSFYRNLTPQEKELADRGQFNFDHPDAFDTERMKKVFMDILECKTVEVPIYNFRTHTAGPETRTIYPTDVVLFEGILVLYDPEMREMMNMKLFVDTDSDTRLARRVVRDINERGRKLDQVLEQYANLVKPAFEEFTLPTKKYADVIIPRGSENQVAIDLIVQHIRDILVGSISYYQPISRWQRKPRVRRESDSYLVRPH